MIDVTVKKSLSVLPSGISHVDKTVFIVLNGRDVATFEDMVDALRQETYDEDGVELARAIWELLND